jgi:hypothetical protein
VPYAARHRHVGSPHLLAVVGLTLTFLFGATVATSSAQRSISGSATVVSTLGYSTSGGTDSSFVTPAATISILGDPGRVEVRTEGTAGWASFTFGGPSGAQLEDREYADAQSVPGSTGLPKLDVGVGNQGCGETYGRFIVKDIHVDAAGDVDRFWALYEQHCVYGKRTTSFGEVRLGEPATGAPEAVAPAAIDWPNTRVGTRGVAVPVAVIAGESGAHVTAVGVEGQNAGDFTVSSDGCTGTVLPAGGRCELDVLPTPTAPGDRVAQLTVMDSSGARITVELAVHGEPALKIDSATLVSEPGDYTLEGTDSSFDTPEAAYISANYSGGGRRMLRVTGEDESESFAFVFESPSGAQLEVGKYVDTVSGASQPAGSAGLSVVKRPGTSCYYDYGRFIVKDIHIDAAGNVDRFWALYEQHCGSPEAPALFGEVRVGEPPTSAPEATVPSAIDWPNAPVGTRESSVPVTVIAGESGAHIKAVGVEGQDAGDFSVVADGCTGSVLSAGARCQITVAAKPTAIGVRVAQLVITNSSGGKTTTPLLLGEAGAFFEPGEPIEPTESGGEQPTETPPSPPSISPNTPTLPVANTSAARSELRSAGASAAIVPATRPHCIVPKLLGRALAKAKPILAAAHCKLGRVRGERRSGSRVIVSRQYPKRGTVLAFDAPVTVSLARRH